MTERPTCPKCGSVSIARIVYGLPGAELMEESRDGKIVLGGCVITGDNPIHACRECGCRWGRPGSETILTPAEEPEG